jgi:lysophospholipase L1-like esterase
VVLGQPRAALHAETRVAAGSTPAAVREAILEGRDLFNDLPMPGYVPCAYPHPLKGRAAAEAALASDDVAVLVARSLVSAGDPARLERAMARAREGGPVTVAVIGGSITAGASATKPENRYGDLVARWWKQSFPAAKIELVNAGIGATGSNYGALRAGRDLLSRRPDFVVVEFAVNDPDSRAAAETLEGLVRQILAQPWQPAAMLLFTMNDKGANAQEWHGKVGRHYGLPMVSFRDALWPEITSGRRKWQDVEADQVHPNDRGHALCASFVAAVLDEALRRLPSKDALPPVKPLPAPLLSDRFEHVRLYEADALEAAANDGWARDPSTGSWKSDRPGSAIEFEVEGSVVLTMHYVVKGPMGKARVRVDGEEVCELNAWFDQTWGGYRAVQEVFRGERCGKHRVRFELLDAKGPGTEFHILGIGAAGLGPAAAAGAAPPHRLDLRSSVLRAAIADNEPLEPRHRAGYSGVADLRHGASEDLFVPEYAGLNFEHIFSGDALTFGWDIFEPRRAPMRLARLADGGVELLQERTEHWPLRSRIAYTLKGDAIDLSFAAVPLEDVWRKHGHIGIFFASYIDSPEDRAIHFIGRSRPGKGDPRPRWIRHLPERHGEAACHRPAGSDWDPPEDPGFKVTLAGASSDLEYLYPFYFGVSRGKALVFMFQRPRAGAELRFAQSPSGGGERNPAWDFVHFQRDYEVGKEFSFRARLVVRDFRGREDAVKAYEEWSGEKVERPE